MYIAFASMYIDDILTTIDSPDNVDADRQGGMPLDLQRWLPSSDGIPFRKTACAAIRRTQYTALLILEPEWEDR